MVGILQFLDFGQAGSSKKFMAHKRRNDGAEAPRNSLEFPTEASKSYQLIHEDIPYSCQVDYHSSKKNACDNEVPIKWLIDEEISSRSKGRNSKPSVVARLMGMDSLPLETKTTVPAKESKKYGTGLRNKSIEVTSTQHAPLRTLSMEQKQKKLSNDTVRNPGSMKLQPREHPQEELLQKFKKDFEAWQSSEMRAKTRRIWLEPELLCDREYENDSKTFKHEYLNQYKTPRCMDARKDSILNKTIGPSCHASSAKETLDSEKGLAESEVWVGKQDRSITLSNKTLQVSKVSNSTISLTGGKMQMPNSPKRIVILKPSIEISDDDENFWLASPQISADEANMQGFLEQVKQRLEFEMQGKSRFSAPTRWSGNESLFDDGSTNPKKVAQRVSKHIKESVAKDNKSTLARSASTRSYRSEAQLSGQRSPQFADRYTRRLLSERMKNVFRDDTDIQFPWTVDGGLTLSREDAEISKPIQYIAKTFKKPSYWEDKIPSNETKFKSSRPDHFCDMASYHEEVSPRKLVRSFSAPLTGTTFGKLLYEDKHVSTAVHVRRKSEATEAISDKMSRLRKDVIEIKSKVSCFKQNFMFKGKFFRKKIQLIEEAAVNELPFTNINVDAPTVLLNFNSTKENLTEVPPSPVSICSSSHDEHVKPGYPSPQSPLDASFAEEPSSSQVSGELSSNLPELTEEERNEEIDKPNGEASAVSIEALEVEDDPKSFLRDILISSGIIEKQLLNQLLSGYDVMAKPISKDVFDNLDKTYMESKKSDDTATHSCKGNIKVRQRMLFDLLDEALSKVVQTTMASYTSTKLYLSARRVPSGKQLMEYLCNEIQKLTEPIAGESYSLESTVARDLKTSSDLFQDGFIVIRTEIEHWILDELIDEIVCDLC